MADDGDAAAPGSPGVATSTHSARGEVSLGLALRAPESRIRVVAVEDTEDAALGIGNEDRGDATLVQSFEETSQVPRSHARSSDQPSWHQWRARVHRPRVRSGRESRARRVKPRRRRSCPRPLRRPAAVQWRRCRRARTWGLRCVPDFRRGALMSRCLRWGVWRPASRPCRPCSRRRRLLGGGVHPRQTASVIARHDVDALRDGPWTFRVFDVGWAVGRPCTTRGLVDVAPGARRSRSRAVDAGSWGTGLVSTGQRP